MIMQDMINGRCGWCGTDELYVKYHDQEWGKLVTDDKTLFEFLVLESAQAGLSWITILRKREGYRKAFCNFDAVQVAQMTDSDVERLMRFDGIVRNRLKIKSTITNARLFLAIQEEFGSFYNYTLSFFPDRKPITNTFGSLSEIPASSPLPRSTSARRVRRKSIAGQSSSVRPLSTAMVTVTKTRSTRNDTKVWER
jgi:DNA-3-methyladenine glycosylase I